MIMMEKMNWKIYKIFNYIEIKKNYKKVFIKKIDISIGLLEEVNIILCNILLNKLILFNFIFSLLIINYLFLIIFLSFIHVILFLSS